MSLTSRPFALRRVSSPAKHPASAGWHERPRRLLVAALFAWTVLPSWLFAAEAAPAVPAKKLIEYGWDVPTPAQMRDELPAMEKRPFDGIIFRLAAGHNAFVTKPLDPAGFAEDERILRSLQFTRFRDNFVLIWGSPPANFDWFNDTQWADIAANAKLLVRIAQAGRVRGICFDPEPYDFSLWDYAKQPGTNSHTFAEYRAKVRQRGAQLMRAFEQPMPGATILTFFHVSLFDRFANLSEDERTERLRREGWGLMPDFFVGMLESASPQARFIDGNESAYYYTSREQYLPRLPCHTPARARPGPGRTPREVRPAGPSRAGALCGPKLRPAPAQPRKIRQLSPDARRAGQVVRAQHLLGALYDRRIRVVLQRTHELVERPDAPRPRGGDRKRPAKDRRRQTPGLRHRAAPDHRRKALASSLKMVGAEGFEPPTYSV